MIAVCVIVVGIVILRSVAETRDRYSGADEAVNQQSWREVRYD